MSRRQLLLMAFIAIAIAVFVGFDLGRFTTLAEIKSRQDELLALVRERPFFSAAIYLFVYVIAAALSLPGAAVVLTLLGGALFGLAWGTVLVSFASSIGATLAFLTSRYLLRDMVRARFPGRIEAIDAGVRRDGGFYLFSLRLIPLFPFFLVNLLMGLTPIRTATFYIASQLGMLAGTLVYVNAGTELARLNSLSGILSPTLIASFVALGLFPLLARKAVDFLAAQRTSQRWRRPKRFDRNLIVIGAGSAGLVTAYIAATLKASVSLIERHKMGGDCLNTGCVPSKALLRSAKLLAQARDSKSLGIRAMHVEFDFADIMARVQQAVHQIEPHDSLERYRSLGVDVIEGEARLRSPWEVEVTTPEGTRTLSSRHIVIAAGARPVVPSIPGIESTGFLTSDTVWSLRTLPRRLLVIGAGPIGCEMALAFARFGSQVTLLDQASRLLSREDPDVSALVAQCFASEGINLRLSTRAIRFEREGVGAEAVNALVAEHDGKVALIEFDQVLCALGRVANTGGYGLEALDVHLTPRGTVQVDPFLRTNYPSILAAGDVAGRYQFTHAAANMAWYAAVNALFGGFWQFRIDERVMPWCTFLDPEVARVGLNEQEATEQGIAVEVTRYSLDDLDRAIVDGATRGFVKVLTRPGSDRILGATIVGEHAGELIVEFVTAMKRGLGLNKLLGTIKIYPTFAEANKYTAGQWKRAHAPTRLLGWVERFHRWQRG